MSGLLLLPAAAWAQVVVSGTVRDTQGQPVPGALVEAQPPGQPSVAVVGVAADDGQYSIRLALDADSVVVRARALGFGEQQRRVRYQAQRLDFALPVSELALKEVVVRAAPIARRGDTLSYQVAAFTDPKDRVIADVLKKLPGVEVEADGRILYQGRAIQKFYINGSDLLQGRYNLASNNLPAGAVQEVQVLERHQPVRALAGVQPSSQASLNIQLKQKVTATGQVQLGIGPRWWQANASPMLFTPRQQLLDTYQTNNTGQDLSTELRQLGTDDLATLSDAHDQPRELTGLQQLAPPPLASHRYLFNQAHLLSANHLLPLRPHTQLRVQATYLHDAQRQTGQELTRFFVPDGGTATLLEQQQTALFFNELQASVALLHNTPRQYLHSTLSVAGRRNAQQGSISRSPDGGLIEQQARQEYQAITHRLGVVRPAGARTILQVTSLLTYATNPQRLVAAPGPLAELLTGGQPYQLARQDARLATCYAQQHVQLLTGRGPWHYSAAAGSWQEVQLLTSALSTTPAVVAPTVPVRNQLAWHRGKYYVQPSLSRQGSHAAWQAELPISFWQFTATDAPLRARQQWHNLVVEPRLNGHRDLGHRWRTSGSIALSNQLAGIEQLHYAFLLRDYRSLVRNDAPLARSWQWTTQADVTYKELLSAVFGHLAYQFTRTYARQLYRTSVRPDGTTVTEAVSWPNQQDLHSLNAGVSKFITPARTTVSLNAAGLQHQQLQLLNDAWSPITNQVLKTTLKASAATFDWGSYELAASLTALRSRVAGTPAIPLGWQQEHHAGLAFYPHAHHQVLVSADYYASRAAGSPIRTLFADATYRYTLPTKQKMDLELRATNLLNTRYYQYSYFNQYLLLQSQYTLRPRQLLVTLRVSL